MNWDVLGFSKYHNQQMATNQLYQALHGPNEDKLKYLGTLWLLSALFIRAQPLGVVGLLVIVAVEVKSEFLLKLVCFADLFHQSLSCSST
jgi:hypothetical protein